MLLIIAIIAGLVLIWPLMNLFGWYTCRLRTKRHPLPYWDKPEPFNWRIFFGPNVYYDWFEER